MSGQPGNAADPAGHTRPEAAFPLVALAGSAGAVHALQFIIASLPADFPAAIVVVIHLVSGKRSLMAEILARCTALPVRQAAEGDRLRPGHILVAPPDRHLCVNPDGTVSLTQTARVHFVRPSADALFESLASSFGPRVIAVVLSGMGGDGAPGVRAVKEGGGVILAQDQASSQFFGMPAAAIATHRVDHVLPLDQIPRVLVELVSGGLQPVVGDVG